MKFLYKYRKIVFIVLGVGLVLVLVPWVRQLDAQAILNFTPKSPIRAAAIIIGLFWLKSVVMIIPSYALYTASGMLLPTGWAILVNYIGLSGELILGFMIGRWLGEDKVRGMLSRNSKTQKIMKYLDSNDQSVFFMTRLLPMPYPVDLGSMFFGATGMPFWSHLVFSLFGISAVMIPFTIAGGAISNPLSAQFLVPFVISISISCGLFFWYKAWIKRNAG